MAKLAIFFLVALAFQASIARPDFFENQPLFNYLDEIKTEVKDLTIFFEKDFPEHHLALETVTWQWHKLIDVVEVIINKLREETFKIHREHKVFEDVIYTLEELCKTLKEVPIHGDVTKTKEIKKYFVFTIHTILNRFEKLVTLTYSYYPEFRYTLKYVLVDFVTALHEIRSHFVHINTGFEVKYEPRHLIKEIQEYTSEFTDILKEFNHPTQVKVALRKYTMYVNEIVHKLQEQKILGHKELDVVMYHLTNKLREIVFPLMEIMHDNTVDMKVFRTRIVTSLFEVASIFEQLVQLCEDKVLPEELTHFLVKVIYHYFYAVRHVTYEIKLGHKIGFFKPEYYNTEFYPKYGYGLYENEFQTRYFAPYKYNNIPMYRDEPTRYPKYMREFEYNTFNPYRYETLFPVRKHETPFFPRNTYNYVPMKDVSTYKYMPMKDVSTYKYTPMKDVSTYKYMPMKDVSTYKYTPMKDVNSFFHQKNYPKFDKYYKPMQYEFEFETPKEMISTIEMLINRAYEQFETKEIRPLLPYVLQEFVEFLDYIIEKYETKAHYAQYYNDKLIEEFFYNIKQIRMEVREIIKVGVSSNVHEIRTKFVRWIEIVSMDLYKLYEKYGFEHIKHIVYQFVTFLNKITIQREHYPLKNFNTESYFPTTHQWTKYY
ncbi:hypothetical protein FQA39_LY18115 [Lamprigera yunnana]|nr:hypothetical protein FQA39_LY18115 [Lamprigera yunnana]